MELDSIYISVKSDWMVLAQQSLSMSPLLMFVTIAGPIVSLGRELPSYESTSK